MVYAVLTNSKLGKSVTTEAISVFEELYAANVGVNIFDMIYNNPEGKHDINYYEDLYNFPIEKIEIYKEVFDETTGSVTRNLLITYEDYHIISSINTKYDISADSFVVEINIK